jgi:hypothetical protein
MGDRGAPGLPLLWVLGECDRLDHVGSRRGESCSALVSSRSVANG